MLDGDKEDSGSSDTEYTDSEEDTGNCEIKHLNAFIVNAHSGFYFSFIYRHKKLRHSEDLQIN